MMDHNELVKEMQHIDKLPVTERVAIARKRRKQQLATYAKWAKTDNFSSRKSKPLQRKGIQFSSEVQLLETAARAANDKGAIDEMRVLLKSGVDPNQMNHDGLTALHQACIDGSLEMVNLLLKAGANVNIVDRDLWTPLHAAATCGHFKIVTTLIRAGANLIAINGDGDLPYDITEDEVTQHYLENEMTKRGITQEFINQARQASHDKMKDDIEYLIEKGGDINQPLDQGGTLLHIAIANCFNDLMEILLENGADITVRDEDGWEPIHVAAYWCNEKALEALAENGANLRSLTHNGEVPYDLCDDPDLKTHFLHIINDRPEYKFVGDKEDDVPLKEDTNETSYEKEDKMIEDAVLESQLLNLQKNKSLYSEHFISEPEGLGRERSSEEVPLNPLLNLQATELSERRNSVKEAKHRAPLKRMNSIEIGSKGKISPYAAKTGLGISGHDKDNILHSAKTLETSSGYQNSTLGAQNTEDQNTIKEILDQKLMNKKPPENSKSDKENTIPDRDKYVSPALSNNINGTSETTQAAKVEEESDQFPKKLIHIPRKKNPAPPPPMGSLLYLKRQRQEARIHQIGMLDERDIILPPREQSTQTSYVYNPPPSPTMIRYHYKMTLDEVNHDDFIKQKKCSIM
ncbi:protein phosphatase 1 regulatory subunit 12C-like [Penaeus indicus]|uniref:protein phosphatase 1 regulatory subunit 12C-like n=1 Tax=Penaeus indicus TaxID=29960 RepID=UPI00300D7E11